MQTNEQLAEWVKAQQDELNKAEISKGRNYMLPPPPEPGVLIRCRICGKVMRPEDFNKDKKIRKREFKWQIHWACQQVQFDKCDLETPGLLAERKQGLRAGRSISDIMQRAGLPVKRKQ